MPTKTAKTCKLFPPPSNKTPRHEKDCKTEVKFVGIGWEMILYDIHIRASNAKLMIINRFTQIGLREGGKRQTRKLCGVCRFSFKFFMLNVEKAVDDAFNEIKCL